MVVRSSSGGHFHLRNQDSCSCLQIACRGASDMSFPLCSSASVSDAVLATAIYNRAPPRTTSSFALALPGGLRGVVRGFHLVRISELSLLSFLSCHVLSSKSI